MSSNNDGIIVILSSPSGTGKTTLAKLILQKKKFVNSVSHTTRIPRSNEDHGKDYFFVKKEIFEDLIKNDEFLEYAKVFDNYYGSRKRFVTENLNNGKNVIFDIDWQGEEQIKNKKLKYKLITFFVLPPSKKVLFDRLSNRDMKDKLTVELRMKEFKKDVLHWKNYDYVVINDNLEDCFSEIAKLIESEINGLEILSKKIDKNFAKAVNIIKKTNGKIIVTGVGKSGIIAKKIAATFSSTGSPSQFIHSTEASHGDLGMIDKKDVVLAFTFSGKTSTTNPSTSWIRL